VGSEAGVSDEKLNTLAEYRNNALFSRREQLALEYAEGMTITGREVSDELFTALKSEFSDEELIVLTEVIAWENASSKFNRALRIPSQGLWKRRQVDRS
jgi:alkylhydroperoxidase family enzyme